MNSGFKNIANVYHIIETGKFIDRIEQTHSISDHPMLIFSKRILCGKKEYK